MSKNAPRQSLQAMISRAIDNSMSKTAADKGSTDKKVKDLVSYEKKEHGHIPTPSEEAAEYEKTSSVDSDFVTKLASAVEWIATNLDKIEFPQGILSKMAEEVGSPVGPGKGPGALTVEKSMEGRQAYKKDKPRGEDAAASQAGTSLSSARPGDSKTQVSNDMHDAPGGGDVQPTGRYPEKGPLVAGPSVKTAENGRTLEESKGRSRSAALSDAMIGGLGGGMIGSSKAPWGTMAGALGGAAAGYGIGYGVDRLFNHMKHKGGGKGSAEKTAENGFTLEEMRGRARKAALRGTTVGALGGAAAGYGLGYGVDRLMKHKEASPIAQMILAKLAGEDTMKANIDGGGTSSPLAGMGQLTTTESSQPSPSQSGDPVSGYGNQGRRLIQTNQAAIDYTKGDAKGPQKSQLKEVLDEPALTASTDSTLKENLRNTGKAGVKIAGARDVLEKVAAAGCTCAVTNGKCPSCRLTTKLAAVAKGKGSEKRANAMMGMGGGGAMPSSPSPPMMSSMANAGAGADGCTCAGAGECKVCKLKAALAAVKAQSPTVGPEGAPVEKDSTMGMGAAPASGIY